MVLRLFRRQARYGAATSLETLAVVDDEWSGSVFTLEICCRLEAAAPGTILRSRESPYSYKQPLTEWVDKGY
ncbi:hypothetical protein BDV35DRAFT_392844 [Aspergillus flavus]|uniref:Uncharacterized protein n=1 Tax=Aspergillus flavus TaxID=5059 RepID=A0A5N6GW70_ASPFL|nr:hypothetical protein BDV35DRAFT_392844 [Aspergillus flavus]